MATASRPRAQDQQEARPACHAPLRHEGLPPERQEIQETRGGEDRLPNILQTYVPKGSNDVWIAGFTYIPWKGTFLYLAIVIDIFTREVLGHAVMTNHSVALTLESLSPPSGKRPRPTIFHSDNGCE